MMSHELVLKIFGALLGLIMGVGTIVVGVVKAIDKSKKEAKDFASATVKAAVEERISHESMIQEEVAALKERREYDQVQILTRLNEIDLWRKDINGQLKLIGAHMQFGNQLLEEQKNATALLATSNQQMSVTLAEIKQFCRLKSGSE